MAIENAVTEQVDDLLRSRGQTQMSLGPVLFLSQTAVSDRFRGRTPWTLADLERLAVHFGVDVADLLMSRVAS